MENALRSVAKIKSVKVVFVLVNAITLNTKVAALFPAEKIKFVLIMVNIAVATLVMLNTKENA